MVIIQISCIIVPALKKFCSIYDTKALLWVDFFFSFCFNSFYSEYTFKTKECIIISLYLHIATKYIRIFTCVYEYSCTKNKKIHSSAVDRFIQENSCYCCRRKLKAVEQLFYDFIMVETIIEQIDHDHPHLESL